MELEIWNPVKNYNGFYEVSNLGNVRSLDRKAFTKSGVLKRTKGKILSKTIKKNGYLTVMLCLNGKQKRFHIHRLVCQAFNKNETNYPMVNHIDGDKKNNHYNNLEWCDSSHNMKHAVNIGLINLGEKSKKSKLNTHIVLAIRRLYKINPKFNKLAVAKKIGVSDTTIHKIINRKKWKHL